MVEVLDGGGRHTLPVVGRDGGRTNSESNGPRRDTDSGEGVRKGTGENLAGLKSGG